MWQVYKQNTFSEKGNSVTIWKEMQWPFIFCTGSNGRRLWSWKSRSFVPAHVLWDCFKHWPPGIRQDSWLEMLCSALPLSGCAVLHQFGLIPCFLGQFLQFLDSLCIWQRSLWGMLHHGKSCGNKWACWEGKVFLRTGCVLPSHVHTQMSWTTNSRVDFWCNKELWHCILLHRSSDASFLLYDVHCSLFWAEDADEQQAEA